MFLNALFNSEFLGGLELEHSNPEIWSGKAKELLSRIGYLLAINFGKDCFRVN